MGYGRYYYRTVQRYKSAAQLRREKKGMYVLFFIAGFCTWGMSWIALICCLIIDWCDSADRRKR